MSNTLLQRGSKYLFIYSRNLVYSCRLAVAHKESCNNIVCEEKEFNLALGEKNSVKPFSSSVCHQLQPNLTAFPPTAFLSRAFIFFFNQAVTGTQCRLGTELWEVLLWKNEKLSESIVPLGKTLQPRWLVGMSVEVGWWSWGPTSRQPLSIWSSWTAQRTPERIQ